MTVDMPQTLILVANNPLGHHLLSSQLLDAYQKMHIRGRVLLLCNGTSQGISEDAYPFVEVLSFGRTQIPAINFLFLFVKLVQLRLAMPNAVYHLRGFVVGLVFYFSQLVTLAKSKFIYDPRGAFFIERREAGKNRCFVGFFRAVEARLISRSQSTIVTTERFAKLYRRIFGHGEKYTVIYNSTSFPLVPSQALNLQNGPVRLVYLGTINYWHDLDEIHRVIEDLTQQIGAHRVEIDIFTPTRFHKQVRQKFSSLFCSRIDVSYVDYRDIPTVLENKHIGISVVRPTLSTCIASPIKVSDYVAFGLIPVLNLGIGDFDQVFSTEKSAVLFRFGEKINLPDFESIRLSGNEKIYHQVSRSQSIERLKKLVDRLFHAK